MNVRAKYSTKLLLLLVVFLAASVSIRANGLDATATYTDMMVSPGLFQYDLTLTNTGTTTIGTFWFSWIPGAGFMGVTPTNVMSPAGWTAMITNMGASIQWTNPSPLAMGASVTGFMFDSTMTPAQFLGTFPGPGLGMGDPITTASYISGCRSGIRWIATPEHKSPRCQQRSSVPRSPARCRLPRSPWASWRLPPEFPASELSPFNVLFAFLSGSGICGIGVAAPVGVSADSFEVKSDIPPDGFCSSPL